MTPAGFWRGRGGVLDLRLFGPIEVTVAGEPAPTPPPKELALLAYLALRASPESRSELHELLWPDGGKGGLRVALSRLRSLPGSANWLFTERHMVEVRSDSDVARFEAALASGDPRSALRAWPDERGPLLAGLEVRRAAPFHAWLEDERARLRLHRSEARRILLIETERNGSVDEAVALARTLVLDDALDEVAHRAVMRLEHARGHTDVALTQFERLRIHLRDELGAEPQPETLAELARIEGTVGMGGERAHVLTHGSEVPSRAAWVLGREQAVSTVAAAVRSSGRVLVHGAGGMGKSTVAAEVAARHLDRGGRVAWVRSAGAEPREVFDALAAALDARPEVARADAPATAVRKLIAAEHIELVVLDDASNAYTVARVADALPQECGLVVTSRQRYPGLQRVRLGRLKRPESVELLAFHAGRDIPRPDADAMCALLGDHPYAVRIAGVALASEPLEIETLMARVRKAPHALALPSDLTEPGRESVGALLEVSLDGLPDEAHEALMGIGALDAPIVTPELLAELTRRDVDSAEDALDVLQRRALAERLTEPGSDVTRYRLHDLTHSLARANTHVRDGTVRRACLRFLEHRARQHSLIGAELGQVVTSVRKTLDATENADAIAAMIRLCGPDGYFNGHGHTPASLALLERAAAVAEEVDAVAAQQLYVKLGNGRRELLGDLGGVRDSYRRAAELARTVGDHGREAIASSAMGCATVAMGEDAGEAVVVAALALARRTGNDLAIAHTLQNLSFVAGSKGRLAEAATLSQEAVTVADRLGPDVDRHEADHKRFFARFNLGVARWRGGNVEGGREALMDALRVAREQRNPAWEGYALNELADLEDARGNAEIALQWAHAALELYDRHRMRADARLLRSWLAEREATE